MKFDEFASEAGRAVVAAAGQAQRPAIGRVEAREHRWTLFAMTSTVAVVFLVVLRTITLWTGDPERSPIADQTTTATESLSTSTEPGVTSTIHPETSSSLPTTFAATRSDIGLGWESVEIPTSVVAQCHRAMVGTDTELVFWGGDQDSCDYEFPTGDPGVAYNPDTGFWRQLPASPLEPAVAPTGVWTGSEVVICCGMTRSRQAVGSTLDLRANTWTALPEALPEPDGCECNLGSQTLTWTGEYVLVSPGVFSTGVDPTTPVLIAYDPDSSTWILVDEASPLAHGGISLNFDERLVIAVDRVFYMSPPNWQPTGDEIPESWSNQ
ncbi:MAG: hypothetical protein ACT4OP_02740 [Actinomycetota bacterium]